jgi:2-dehydro-3-deoxyphosphogluconate aldolase/(4S)-4-hydroxy-2-oxoglutarate aldolase
VLAWFADDNSAHPKHRSCLLSMQADCQPRKDCHLTREEIRKQILDLGLIPSIRVDSAEAAMFAAESVAAGGIPIVEITTTIPDSDQVIRDLTQRFPSIIVGAEIVAGLDQARRKLDAGAMFLTGPGFDSEVTGYCVEEEIVVIPGALTPTEVMHASKAGADFVKVFPCSYVGGQKYIRALKAPFPDVQLVAAGGVTQSAAPLFIAAGAVALGVGEDLIPRQAVRLREGAWIRELAARFLNFVRQARAELG